MSDDMRGKSVVCVIDDDPSILRGLGRLMKAHGLDTALFSSARMFLESGMPCANACLVIDMAMPEMNGLQLFAELRRRGCQAPAIFITALDDIAVRKSVKQAGGAAFLRKPVDGGELLEAVRAAWTARAPA